MMIRIFALMIEKAFDHFILQYTFFENLLTVILLHFYVLNDVVFFLNPHQRPQFTEALASCFFDSHMGIFIMGRKYQRDARYIFCQFLEFLINFF